MENSELSNTEIDKKIEKILTEFKNNTGFAPAIQQAKASAKKNIKVKIDKYFP